jgi:hypothetical protein
MNGRGTSLIAPSWLSGLSHSAIAARNHSEVSQLNTIRQLVTDATTPIK